MNTFWKDKNILVTGHTGFKGTWLSVLLSNLKANVYGYSESYMFDNHLFRNTIKDSKSIKTNIGNINDLSALNSLITNTEPDIVFHLAAQPLVIESYKNPLNTWNTNVIGTLNLLESLKDIKKKCLVIIITTDKVYENKEWEYNYRENDILGGNDPYSASKAACEIAVSSWIKSFIGNESYQNSNLQVSTVRAGNVIGGGDWSNNRIVPDTIKSIIDKSTLTIRNPNATRPWQHVIEPLWGYLKLAEYMDRNNGFSSAFNFGPTIHGIKTVKQLIEEIQIVSGINIDVTFEDSKFHESQYLGLSIDKAQKHLEWQPKWDFSESIRQTVQWYLNVNNGEDPLIEINKTIDAYLGQFD